MSLNLDSLKKALQSLEQVVQRSIDKKIMAPLDYYTQKAIKAGVIQNFEFTYELCWKFMKRWIRVNISPEESDHPRTRKELFRVAAKNGLIHDPIPWFKYGDARNLMSHTYDEEKADEVYGTALEFVKDAKDFLHRLEKKND